MHAAWAGALETRLLADPGIDRALWTETFTPARFAMFVLTHMLVALARHEPDVAFLIEVVRRTRYQEMPERKPIP